MKAKILYVEDDDSLSFITKDQLEMESYDVTHSANGKDAWSIFKKGEFDLCLLDVMLPQMDGFELAKKIRAVSKHVPIIFLTAKSMVEDKMEGFLLGGDDYVTKPYSFEELKMRIDVFLRRRKIIEEAPKEAIIIGKYNFDYANLDLSINGTSKGLTQREADILYYLAARPNQVIRRSDILEDIWGKDDYFYGRSLDVFISRLRKYLNEDPDITIENVHSVGFKLNFPDGKIVE
ncbi:MAG: response regulator transcription factor [Saprospiraceae bacterium]|nr:response regulator transcription factor [Candidatus Opimibacter skivensis]